MNQVEFGGYVDRLEDLGMQILDLAAEMRADPPVDCPCGGVCDGQGVCSIGCVGCDKLQPERARFHALRARIPVLGAVVDVPSRAAIAGKKEGCGHGCRC